MALPHGGHLTHGAKVSVTGKYFNAVSYGLDEGTHQLDYENIRRLALEHKPKMIIAGHSAYPRVLDFAKFRGIADEAGAVLMVDMAHFAGLVAGGAHPSPVLYADVVTTTTHKTLRGPRGGMILCKEKHAAAIDKAVFPGIQGGPHNHTTAAMAVAFKEAMQPGFKKYAAQVVANAQALAAALCARGFALVTGGTDNHLMLVDLTNKNVSGRRAAAALNAAGIVLNCNAVPFDPRKPFDPSGVRIGTAAVTSRGFTEAEMEKIAAWINEVVHSPDDTAIHGRIAGEVAARCKSFPPPGLD
jgi:glycine hydroxymethyltransferase